MILIQHYTTTDKTEDFLLVTGDARLFLCVGSKDLCRPSYCIVSNEINFKTRWFPEFCTTWRHFCQTSAVTKLPHQESSWISKSLGHRTHWYFSRGQTHSAYHPHCFDCTRLSQPQQQHYNTHILCFLFYMNVDTCSTLFFYSYGKYYLTSVH